MAADLWWGMFAFGSVVLVAVVALWLYALFRTPHDYDEAARKRIFQRWVIGGGLVLPGVSIVILLAFGIPMGHRMLPLPLVGEQALRIELVGHRWWWEIRYPEAGVVTANHLVIPAGRPVDFHVTSADVIHAFWVPRLGGKIDMLPGVTNVIRLHADQPGEFRGQCAEFCGAQHARMILTVQALEVEEFEDWLAARRPDPSRERTVARDHVAAMAAFQPYCGQCHAVAGVSEGNARSPDLTDLGSRPTLGAGTLPNSTGATRRWLREHQDLKPGNSMPRHDKIAAPVLDEIAEWLESLKP